VDCDTIGVGHAIHFSHYGLHLLYEDNQFPFESDFPLSVEDRANAARVMMDQCGGSNVVKEEMYAIKS